MHAQRNNETGMVYRGREDLVHIKDGFRADVGALVAETVDDAIRSDAIMDGLDSYDEVRGEGAKKLCPGCYMTVIFNAARELALRNGQSLSELGRTLSAQFAKLVNGDTGPVEEVHVVLDNEAGEPMSTSDMVGYLTDFGPNPMAQERDYGIVPAVSSVGMDAGLVDA